MPITGAAVGLYGDSCVKFKALLDRWQKGAGTAKTEKTYAVHLPVADAAQLQALAELFPGRSVEDLIRWARARLEGTAEMWRQCFLAGALIQLPIHYAR